MPNQVKWYQKLYEKLEKYDTADLAFFFCCILPFGILMMSVALGATIYGAIHLLHDIWTLKW